MLDNLRYLKVNLPEDILILKSNGDFEAAQKLINRYLKKPITTALRKRLEIETEILSILKEEYPYSFEEALKKMQDSINNFTREELVELKENFQADWILINGKVHFNDSFYGSLLLTREDLANRLINKQESDNKRAEFLNENIIYTKENKKASYYIKMRSSIKLKDEAVKKGHKLKVYLPLPISCQQSNIKILNTTPKAMHISDESYPSRTAYFETVLDDKCKFTAEYSYEVTLDYNDLNASLAIDSKPSFCTDELEPHIMFTPYIKELAKEITKEELNPLIKARKIYDYITQNVKYSYMRAYSTITNIPEYCALNLKGDCGVQALLFITLCRCVNIPAKWQSGLAVTPYHVGPHDWAQFYVEPFGWLYADPSFGGSAYRNNNMEKWNFYFGNLDPFRMVANSEFQHEFDPPKQFWRHDPYDNQVGECEWEDKKIKRNEFIAKYELVEMKRIDIH